MFVMTLGYSRHMYAEVVFNQRSTTWIALHQRALRFFGGAPETLVPDNLKAAVIRAAFAVDDDSEINRIYRAIPRWCRCQGTLCARCRDVASSPARVGVGPRECAQTAAGELVTK